MNKIINDNDLGIPCTNAVNRAVVDFAKSLLGLNRLNELYDKLFKYQGVEFAHQLLRELDIKVDVKTTSLDNIPETGAFIAIANHPHGALDGILLADLIVRKRRDTKFMGNFLLEKVEPMREMFLSVNPFNSKAARNVPAIRTALLHLQEGGGLIIFPAGEVSTYYNGFSICEDKEWDNAIVKFIQVAKVPVLPLYISGKNSLKFHLVGKVHPKLRTVRLPLELLNKVGRKIDIIIGSTVSVKRQGELKGIIQFRDYLRANIYFMMKTDAKKPIIQPSPQVQEVALAVNSSEIEREIMALDPTLKLFTTGDVETYCSPACNIKSTLKEICRLREVAFRLVGEGTNRSEDVDKFDSYYHHLFLWHKVEKRVIGAYRVGFGDKILDEHGIEGFYTNTLFEYSSKFAEVLGSSIELGRSFIIPEYQKRTKPLMMLWQGILTILLKYHNYQYLLGPVSMSNSYSNTAKLIAINYIKQHHWSPELAKMVIARNGIKQILNQRLNMKLLANISDINLIDKLIIDIDVYNTPLPILLRKYLQLGGVVLSFNVDAAFNDSLDALLLLDISKVPHNTIEMLSKEYNIEEVSRRFSK